MLLLEEFKIFVKNISHWIYSFTLFSFFFFLFGFKEIIIWGKSFYLPLLSKNGLLLVIGGDTNLPFLSENSLAVQVFNKIRIDLLPSNVQLITTNPITAFSSQVSLSIFLAFIFTLPLLLYKIILYLHPALLPREKKAVIWSLVPSVLLFISGCIFSYYFIIPQTFKVLYPFATSMGVAPFFSIEEFIRYVFGLIVSVGLTFLLPLLVIMLSFLGVIKADFWLSKWRFAVMFFLILSAIIAPDVVTMIMLFIPMTALYFAGCIFAKRFA